MRSTTRSPMKLAAAAPWTGLKIAQHDKLPGGNYLEKHRWGHPPHQFMTQREAARRFNISRDTGVYANLEGAYRCEKAVLPMCK